MSEGFPQGRSPMGARLTRAVEGRWSGLPEALAQPREQLAIVLLQRLKNGPGLEFSYQANTAVRKSFILECYFDQARERFVLKFDGPVDDGEGAGAAPRDDVGGKEVKWISDVSLEEVENIVRKRFEDFDFGAQGKEATREARFIHVLWTDAFSAFEAPEQFRQFFLHLVKVAKLSPPKGFKDELKLKMKPGSGKVEGDAEALALFLKFSESFPDVFCLTSEKEESISLKESELREIAESVSDLRSVLFRYNREAGKDAEFPRKEVLRTVNAMAPIVKDEIRWEFARHLFSFGFNMEFLLLRNAPLATRFFGEVTGLAKWSREDWKKAITVNVMIGVIEEGYEDTFTVLANDFDQWTELESALAKRFKQNLWETLLKICVKNLTLGMFSQLWEKLGSPGRDIGNVITAEVVAQLICSGYTLGVMEVQKLGFKSWGKVQEHADVAKILNSDDCPRAIMKIFKPDVELDVKAILGSSTGPTSSNLQKRQKPRALSVDTDDIGELGFGE